MPNSILWIGLVVLWLFVLFPMLADRHPRIRQTTDAALATRVLHRGGSKRKTERGPAAGHESDPDWIPAADSERTHRRGNVAEDQMDIDTEQDDRPDVNAEADVTDHDDRPESDDRSREFVPVRRGRGGFDPEADAIARAARYAFRQRAVLALLFATLGTASLGFVVAPTFWWLCAAMVVALGGYLSYLRKQVTMEEEIRRRRMARLGRARLGVESQSDEELRLTPARLRRPGAVVLETDDEDPVFEHLDHMTSGEIVRVTEPPSSAQMRRAAGE